MPADRRTDSSAEPAKEPPSLLACADCFAQPMTCEGKPAVIVFRVFAQGPLSATSWSPSLAFLVVACISLTMGCVAGRKLLVKKKKVRRHDPDQFQRSSVGQGSEPP